MAVALEGDLALRWIEQELRVMTNKEKGSELYNRLKREDDGESRSSKEWQY